MAGLWPRWLTTRPLEQQLLISAVVLDPLGFIAGYLLGPSLGVEPLIGGVFGLVAASIPMSMLVMRETQ